MKRRQKPVKALDPAQLVAAGSAVALALVLGSSAAPALAQDGDPGGQWFSLPIDRGAAQVSEEALAHLAAKRWDLAVEVLQDLVEDRPENLLPDGFGADLERPSQMAHHLGAGQWARLQLAGLPRAALDRYEQRFGPKAEEALARALDAGSADELRSVADRYPAARAAAHALRAAGDLSFANGQLTDAALTWTRADALERRLGSFDGVAAAARRAALAQLVPEGADRRGDAGFRLPGPGEAPGPVPRGEREVWSVQLPENPFAFDSLSSNYPNIFPVLHEDKVYVSTTLNVVCLDAFEGVELWRSEEPPGWASLSSRNREDLSKAIDKEAQIVAPAIGSGVVVAAQQIPFAALPNDDYQGFVIMRALPDRRLFAFDAETGETLWRHLPPVDWDGQSGAFTERMSVAGAPIVAGPRVIAPMFRMEGRVDLHIAAFDLRTGNLLWSTPLISGQRELNMFNRHEREYSAPPVRVEGDAVLVATHLGTVAALDLFSGAVRWQATYDQIPLPKTHGLISADRTAVWKNAPPVVSGDVVLATPLDSEDLVAIDLGQGAVLWSQPRHSLRPQRQSDSEVDVLLGAGERDVFLGGDWVASWRKPNGLDDRAPLLPGGLREDLGASSPRIALRAPRAVLTDELVLVPAREGLAAYDRDNGAEEPAVGFPWERDERGNLAVGPGLLITTTNRRISGFLDLGVLEARATQRLAAAPNDPEAALELARLLDRRARLERELGHVGEALGLLARARDTIEPLADDGAYEVRAELAANLLFEAELRRSEGQSDAARALLERGLDVARESGQVRDLLLALLPLVRTRDTDAWLAALDELGERAGELDVATSTLVVDPEWLGFARVGSGALRSVPAGAWALVQRALWAEQRGHFAEALDDWHAVLARWSDVVLAPDVTLGARATERIGDLIAAGGRVLYRPFEERAQRLLENALAVGDGDALDRLPRLYPFAAATQEARAARLTLALEEPDVEALARSVGGLLAELDPRLDAFGRAQLAARLAIGLGRAGNVDFERALLTRIAASWPDLELVDAPYAGQRVEDVVARFELPSPGPPPLPQFGEDLVLGDSLPGPWHLLGLPPLGANASDDGSPRPLLIATDDSLLAFDVEQPDKPLWERRPPLDELPLDRPERWTLTSTRAVVGSDGLIVAQDVSSGRPAWIHALGRGVLRSVCATDGVVVVQAHDPLENAYELIGLDAVGGARLWTTPLPPGRGWWPPLAADGHLVSIAYELLGPADACVLDPFTGELRGVVPLPDKLGSWADRAPWIVGDRLLLPSPLKSTLAAVDLARLEQAWTVELGSDRDLRAVLTFGARVFVVAEGNEFGASAKRGAIIEVDPRLGSRRTVYTLDRDDRVLGVRRGDRLELTAPMVFTVSSPSGDERARVTAIDLDRGRRWIQELATTEPMLWEPAWARAVVSEGTVALFYAQRARRSGSRQRVWLDLFDRNDGTRLRRQQVAREYETLQSLTPLAIGDTLWMGCRSPSGSLDRIDRWRNER